MNKTKAEQKTTFQIKGIELIDFKLNKLEQPLAAQTTFHFNIALEQRVNNELKVIFMIANIDILHEDQKTVLASIKVSCIFEVENFEEFIDKTSQRLVLPEAIQITLSSITISTVRGVMFSQFRGTHLHNAILPIIDPKSMVKNNLPQANG